MHLALIGYGAIARGLLATLSSHGGVPARLTVLSRKPLELPDARVVHRTPDLLAARPDLVVECAGHEAVRDHACATLRAGIETLIVSAGALADPDLLAMVRAAARTGRTRAVIPPGAVGAIDVLAALRPSGLQSVTYTGRKPPGAWGRNDPSETVIFEGTAREAALAWSKNANVAATIALAGAGFEGTRVRLVSDPGVTRNVHEIAVRAGAADFAFRIEGHPSPDNPKTSATTALSVAREVMNRGREVVL